MSDDMSGFDLTSDIEAGDLDSGAATPHNPAIQDVNQSGNDTAVAPKGTVRPEQAPAPKPTDERKSLRDQIAAAVKGDAPPQAPEAAPAPGERPRNADGTFAPAPAPEAAPAAPQAPAIQPPSGMSAEDAQVFSKLPAEMQQYVARTMETVNNQAARFGQLTEVENVLSPRMQGFAMQGMTPGQVVGQLFALSDFAEKDPVGFIRYFSQNRGVDLEEVLFGDDGGQQPQQSPEYLQLQQQLQQLQQQVSTREQQEAQERQRQTADRIIQFFDEKDANGTAIRPYANDVGQVILPYIKMVRDQNPNMAMEQVLQEAYDRACWATPEVRAKLQERTKDAQKADELRQQQERLRSKRDASSSIAPTTPSNPATPDSGKHGGSLRDTIRAAMATQ